jgi:cytochrome b subunit of formate dehydrogenase
MAVEEHLAITLYHFGHDGNVAGLQGVVNWAAVGKGTVLLVTWRVMTAILWPEFMEEAVHFPQLRRRRQRRDGSISIHAKLGVMYGVLLMEHLYL